MLPMAKISRYALEDAGIACRLDNAGIVSTHALLSAAVGDIRLDVPESLVASANDVLNAARAAALEAEADDSDDDDIESNAGISDERPQDVVDDPNPYRQPQRLAESSSSRSKQTSVLNRLHSWRKPVFMLFLIGPLGAVAVLVVWIMSALAEAVASLFR